MGEKRDLLLEKNRKPKAVRACDVTLSEDEEVVPEEPASSASRHQDIDHHKHQALLDTRYNTLYCIAVLQTVHTLRSGGRRCCRCAGQCGGMYS
jgi:hypothetical protein